jgi:hypothetical protein
MDNGTSLEYLSKSVGKEDVSPQSLGFEACSEQYDSAPSSPAPSFVTQIHVGQGEDGTSGLLACSEPPSNIL